MYVCMYVYNPTLSVSVLTKTFLQYYHEDLTIFDIKLQKTQRIFGYRCGGAFWSLIVWMFFWARWAFFCAQRLKPREFTRVCALEAFFSKRSWRQYPAQKLYFLRVWGAWSSWIHKGLRSGALFFESLRSLNLVNSQAFALWSFMFRRP